MDSIFAFFWRLIDEIKSNALIGLIAFMLIVIGVEGYVIYSVSNTSQQTEIQYRSTIDSLHSSINENNKSMIEREREVADEYMKLKQERIEDMQKEQYARDSINTVIRRLISANKRVITQNSSVIKQLKDE